MAETISVTASRPSAVMTSPPSSRTITWSVDSAVSSPNFSVMVSLAVISRPSGAKPSLPEAISTWRDK